MGLSAGLRVIIIAWRAESQRRALAHRQFVETQFLPAALEVMETPPSPLGRLVMGCIGVTVVAALVWSFAAKIDTVAVAQGRLTPTGRLRSVEPLAAGIVREIAVREGEHVKKGQLLVAMDPTVADADAQGARAELSTANLVVNRANALIGYAREHRRALIADPDATPQAIEAEQQVVEARIRAYEAKLQTLRARRAGAEAAVRVAQSEIGKLEKTLPILRDLLRGQMTLEAQGFGSHLRTVQQQQSVINAEHDLESQRGRLEEASAQAGSILAEADELKQAFIGQAAQERSEAVALSVTRAGLVEKTALSRRSQRLTSPTNGVVQSISITTMGEVVEPGQTVVTLVPDGELLIVEALLLNKDRGSVTLGAPVIVKLDAFPFTRYGALQGKVTHIASDAVVDETRGLVFPIKVTILHERRSPKQHVRLSAGMSASVEIVTGKRRVIDFLTSPVARAVSEAGREP